MQKRLTSQAVAAAPFRARLKPAGLPATQVQKSASHYTAAAYDEIEILRQIQEGGPEGASLFVPQGALCCRPSAPAHCTPRMLCSLRCPVSRRCGRNVLAATSRTFAATTVPSELLHSGS